MSVGLLIVTHERIASALVDTALGLFDDCPMRLRIFPISRDCNPDTALEQARRMVDDIDEGKGVLVLSDFFGSTPSNIAHALVDAARVWVVTGINLPMLVRVMNYPDLDLAALAEKAVSGGRDGVMLCPGSTLWLTELAVR